MDRTADLEHLASALLNSTRSGKVQWSETADENMFRSMFEKGAVRIARIVEYADEPDGDDIVSYKLYILTFLGKIATEFVPARQDVCSELFDAARESARDSGAVIDSIFAELGVRPK